MKSRNLIIPVVVIFFLLSLGIARAAAVNVIFDLATLANNLWAGLWRIFNNTEEELDQKDGGLLLKNDGDAYLVYGGQFSYYDYDRLRLVIASNKPVRLTVIPNVSTTGYHTHELRRELSATTEPTEVTVSLRLPFFKKPVKDFGINFYSGEPSEILIKEISLEKLNFGELVGVAVQDYWRVFEYSPFTVNLFAAPRIFGHAALVYFLPVILVLIWSVINHKRWRRTALLLLLTGWLVIDGRMMYEFVNYHLNDYYHYVKPPAAAKSFRTYGDFYQFADWSGQHLAPDQAVNFYKSGSAQFPRIMQYLIYPVLINDETAEAPAYLVYNRQDISYHQDDRSLYIGDNRLSQAGEITEIYNDYSFIFQEQ